MKYSELIFSLAIAAITYGKPDDKLNYLDIHPSYRKDSQLPVKPGVNPFRRATPAEDRVQTPMDNTSVSSQILQSLGNNPVGGVLESKGGIPTVVISGEVYTLND